MDSVTRRVRYSNDATLVVRLRRRVAWSVQALAFAAAIAPNLATGLEIQVVQNLLEVVPPTGEENRWQQIPWMVSLTEARRKALAEHKPILLWQMDGHPCGAT